MPRTTRFVGPEFAPAPITMGRKPAPIILCLMLAACEAQRTSTPAEMTTRYHALVDTLSFDRPGTSAAALTSFLAEAKQYDIADSVETKIPIYRGATWGRYHGARELARHGEFDRAEEILKDLTLVDTEDGKSATEHLAFDFYMEKAKYLLVRQRVDDARAVAEYLLTRDINRFQRNQAEQVLDVSGHIDGAMSMVESQKVVGACKQLIVLFATRYADNGYYPPTFDLTDLEQLDGYSKSSIIAAISRIESYSATQDHYTLVALGTDGRRYTIDNGELK